MVYLTISIMFDFLHFSKTKVYTTKKVRVNRSLSTTFFHSIYYSWLICPKKSFFRPPTMIYIQEFFIVPKIKYEINVPENHALLCLQMLKLQRHFFNRNSFKNTSWKCIKVDKSQRNSLTFVVRIAIILVKFESTI